MAQRDSSGSSPSRRGTTRSRGGTDAAGGAAGRFGHVEDADAARRLAETIVDTVRESVLVLDRQLHVVAANEAVLSTFGLSRQETLGRLVYDLGEGCWDAPALRQLLEDEVAQRGACSDFELTLDCDGTGQRHLLVNARQLDAPPMIVLALEDVSGKQAAEERYRTALQHSPVVFAHVDPELRYEWIFNPHTDFDPTSVAGLRDDDLDQGPGIDALMRLKRHVLERGEQERERIAFHRSDGVNWYDVTVTPVTGPDGSVERLVTASLDVTELKETKAALNEREESYQRLVEQSAVGIARKNLDGTITLANAALCAMLGYAEDELVGLDYLSLTHPDDRERNRALFERLREEGRSFTTEKRYHRKDGREVWVELYAAAVRDADGRPREAVTIVTDITARKTAEEARRASEQLLEAVLEKMPSGVSIAEAPSGRLLYHNEEAVRLLRHPLLTSDDRAGYAQYGAVFEDGSSYNAEDYPITRALDGAVVHQEEMRYRRGDGTFTTFLVNAAPVRDTDGRIVRAVSTFHDISTIKRTQEELRRLNESLEQRVAERTDQVKRLASQLTLAEQSERRRISRMLHDDIQQTLYSIQLQVRVAARDVAASERERAEQRLSEIDERLQECAETTRALTADLSPLILQHEGLHETLQWLSTQMHERHDLHVAIEAPHAFRTPDEDLRVLLFRLVRELLRNVAEHAQVDRADVRLRDIDHHVEIVVEDEGRGFAVAEAEAAERNEAGFSLFSMRERLQLFGGDMEIESSPGAGTRVTVRAPLRLT